MVKTISRKKEEKEKESSVRVKVKSKPVRQKSYTTVENRTNDRKRKRIKERNLLKRIAQKFKHIPIGLFEMKITDKQHERTY